MSQIDQIQITFAAAHDRLLLRISSKSGEEFRFWLTRRFVKAMRPALTRSLALAPRIRTQASPAARHELLEFERARAVDSADFRTPYRRSAKSLPLGTEPVLLTRFRLQPRPGDSLCLTLAPEAGPGIDLALDPPLAHSLSALLERALAGAGWDLPPTPSDALHRDTAGTIN